jgi:hypothetical protein
VRELQPGGELAGYRIDAVERQESGAAVLLARDLSADRAVVLHVAHEPPGDVSTARFLERVNRLSGIEHPHLLEVFGARTLEGRCVAVCEAPSGRRLDRFKPRRAQAVEIVRQIADAVDTLEHAGADAPPLQPDRIWVDEAGAARLDGLYAPASLLPRAASSSAELAHLLESLTPRPPKPVMTRALEGVYLSAGQFASELGAAESEHAHRRRTAWIAALVGVLVVAVLVIAALFAA